MGIVGVRAGGGNSVFSFTFFPTRSVALKEASVSDTNGSLCHSRMVRRKRWECVMALEAAVSVCPSE